jgi:hypothetical protein
MRHLTDEELFSIVTDESSSALVSHLKGCDTCNVRFTIMKGGLTLVDAWNIEDHIQLIDDPESGSIFDAAAPPEGSLQTNPGAAQFAADDYVQASSSSGLQGLPPGEVGTLSWRSRMSDVVADFLKRAQDPGANLKDRLAAVIRAPEGLAAAALEIIIDATGRGQILIDSAKSCALPGMQFAYSLSDAPTREGGGEAPTLMPDQGSFFTAKAKGRVVLEPGGSTVVLLFPRTAMAPTVILIPSADDSPAQIGEPEVAETGIRFVFKNIPNDFLLTVFP